MTDPTWLDAPAPSTWISEIVADLERAIAAVPESVPPDRPIVVTGMLAPSWIPTRQRVHDLDRYDGWANIITGLGYPGQTVAGIERWAKQNGADWVCVKEIVESHAVAVFVYFDDDGEERTRVMGTWWRGHALVGVLYQFIAIPNPVVVDLLWPIVARLWIGGVFSTTRAGSWTQRQCEEADVFADCLLEGLEWPGETPEHLRPPSEEVVSVGADLIPNHRYSFTMGGRDFAVTSDQSPTAVELRDSFIAAINAAGPPLSARPGKDPHDIVITQDRDASAWVVLRAPGSPRPEAPEGSFFRPQNNSAGSMRCAGGDDEHRSAKQEAAACRASLGEDIERRNARLHEVLEMPPRARPVRRRARLRGAHQRVLRGARGLPARGHVDRSARGCDPDRRDEQHEVRVRGRDVHLGRDRNGRGYSRGAQPGAEATKPRNKHSLASNILIVGCAPTTEMSQARRAGEQPGVSADGDAVGMIHWTTRR